MRLGQSFKVLREQLGIKQSDIVQIRDNTGKAIISVVTLSRWENGHQDIGFDKVVQLFDNMKGVDIGHLFYIREQAKIKHSNNTDNPTSSITDMYLPLDNDDNYKKSHTAMRKYIDVLDLEDNMPYNIARHFTSELYEYIISNHGKEELTPDTLDKYISGARRDMSANDNQDITGVG